jgi:hypothetical protein
MRWASALVGIGDTAEMAAFAAGLLMLTCTHLGVTNSKNPMIKPKTPLFLIIFTKN